MRRWCHSEGLATRVERAVEETARWREELRSRWEVMEEAPSWGRSARDTLLRRLAGVDWRREITVNHPSPFMRL